MSTAEEKSLPARMKEYEQKFEMKVSAKNCFVVRLDGKNFSKFTRGFKKPFDLNFMMAMHHATLDTFKYFQASVGYCHSDEASFYFPAVYDPEVERVHMYNGRILKICTTMAGYFSVKFVQNLKIIMHGLDKDYSINTMSDIFMANITFDARILEFADDMEAVNHMIWRSCYDCHRNCVATYAQANFSAKELQGKKTPDMIEMLKDKGINYEDIPEHHKYGIYFKNEQYQHTEGIKVTSRSKSSSRTLNVLDLTDNIRMMSNKYWTDDIGAKLNWYDDSHTADYDDDN